MTLSMANSHEASLAGWLVEAPGGRWQSWGACGDQTLGGYIAEPNAQRRG